MNKNMQRWHKSKWCVCVRTTNPKVMRSRGSIGASHHVGGGMASSDQLRVYPEQKVEEHHCTAAHGFPSSRSWPHEVVRSGFRLRSISIIYVMIDTYLCRLWPVCVLKTFTGLCLSTESEKAKGQRPKNVHCLSYRLVYFCMHGKDLRSNNFRASVRKLERLLLKLCLIWT